MGSPPVHHVDIRAFCYATELADRVEHALLQLYPTAGTEDEPAIERTVTEGHHGDRIEVFELSLERTAECSTFFEQLQRIGDLETIIAELEDRVTEECDLFLRFDKQLAYTDSQLEFGEGIEVRIKLEAYPAKRSAAIENITEYLTALENSS